LADFLDINGVQVSVADGSFADDVIDIGDRDRAVDGSLIQTRVTLKQKYTFTTALGAIVPADGVAWRQFINGYGHHWGFGSSVYSGKGLGPSGPSALYVQSGAGGRWAGMLQVDGSPYSGGVFQVAPTGLDSITNAAGNFNVTVMFWARAQDGVTWNHYVLTLSPTTVYKNGVLASADADTNCFTESSGPPSWFEFKEYGYTQNSNVAVPTWVATHAYAANAYVQPTAGHANGRLYQVTAGGGGNSGGSEPTWPTVLGNTVVDGAITWTDRGPISLFISDLVVLPFIVPTSWISSLYTFMNTQAYPDNPLLYCSGLGPMVANNMIGSVGTTKLVQGTPPGGSFTQNLPVINFTLEEA